MMPKNIKALILRGGGKKIVGSIQSVFGGVELNEYDEAVSVHGSNK